MALQYQENGYLIPGEIELTWDELIENFGFNKHRKKLLAGLEKGIKILKSVGCKTIFIGGSFVTKEVLPNDFDVCWDPQGVNCMSLFTNHPILSDFLSDRSKQKLHYYGEFLPGLSFVDFFKTDRSGIQKGVVKINI